MSEALLDTGFGWDICDRAFPTTPKPKSILGVIFSSKQNCMYPSRANQRWPGSALQSSIKMMPSGAVRG
jgi:hypothetical protein